MKKTALIVSSVALLSVTSCKTPPAKSPEKGKAGGENSSKAAKVKLPEPARESLKVYTGPDGLKVAMVRLKDHTYLIRITGTTSTVDNVVLRYRHNHPRRSFQNWVTTIDGRDHYLMNRKISTNGTMKYDLYLPNAHTLTNLKLKYDKELSQKLTPEELIEAHKKSLANDKIAEIQRFHKKAVRQEEMATLKRRLKRLKRRFQIEFEVELDWASIKKQDPEHYTFKSGCWPVMYAIKTMAKYPTVQDVFQGSLKKVICRRGPVLKIEKKGSTLIWTSPVKPDNRDQRARKLLAEEVTWPHGRSIASMAYYDRALFCTDDKGLHVGIKPQRAPKSWTNHGKRILYYGDDKSLRQVRKIINNISDNKWFEPRYPSKRRRRNYTGAIYFQKNKKTCSLRCGDKTRKMRPMSSEEVKKLLKNAQLKGVMKRRVPHGLARNRRGVYYYVDRAAGKPARDYRFYKGPLGKLKRMKMTNIVSDSKGDVFATPNGKLRLVLEKEHSFWMRGKRKEKLINVPIEKNYALIFNELGVYLGKPYGTPCDEF